jgi:hypothetical protein
VLVQQRRLQVTQGQNLLEVGFHVLALLVHQSQSMQVLREKVTPLQLTNLAQLKTAYLLLHNRFREDHYLELHAVEHQHDHLTRCIDDLQHLVPQIIHLNIVTLLGLLEVAHLVLQQVLLPIINLKWYSLICSWWTYSNCFP